MLITTSAKRNSEHVCQGRRNDHHDMTRWASRINIQHHNFVCVSSVASAVLKDGRVGQEQDRWDVVFAHQSTQ